MLSNNVSDSRVPDTAALFAQHHELLAGLVQQQAFEKIISWLRQEGIQDHELEETLVALARQAIAAQQFELARGILFIELGNDPLIRRTRIQLVETNRGHLKHIDSAITDEIFAIQLSSGDNLFLQQVKSNEDIYSNDNGRWRKEIPSAARLTRGSLLARRFGFASIIRITSPLQLRELVEAVQTTQPNFFKHLCFVIVDFRRFASFLTVVDIGPLSACDYLFRFIDEGDMDRQLTRAILDDDAAFPVNFVHFAAEDASFADTRLNPLLIEIEQEIMRRMSRCSQELATRYPAEFYRTVPGKISNKSLRVMFMTSRYTTFLQYSTRDLAAGFQQLGCDVFIEMEKENESVGIRSDVGMRYLSRFQPDLIISFSHLRYEYSYIPASIPYICWVQDMLQPIASGNHVSRCGRADIFITEVYHEPLTSLGYQDVRKMPLAVNEELFSCCAPDPEEYSYQIAHVAHFPQQYPLDEQGYYDLNRLLFKLVQAKVPDPFNPATYDFVTLSDYEQLLIPYLMQVQVPGLENCRSEVVWKIWATIGNYLAKTMVLKNLIQQGYEPALWGKGWELEPEFSPYARGAVAHGKDLAMVINRSKINLSLCFSFTGHHRVFEIIASGGFLLIGYIKPEKDDCPVTDYLQEGEGYQFFYGKEDLNRKIDYYLNNDEERRAIIHRGRDKVLENFTVKKTAQTLLDIVHRRFANS